MNREILIKYLNNNCSDSELNEFVEWVNRNADTKESKSWSFNEWKKFEPQLKEEDEKKYSLLLDKIHHEINLQQPVSKTASFSKVLNWLGRAAAILLIPVLGILFYVVNDRDSKPENYLVAGVDSVEVIAPVGSRTIVQLSDGTEVNLNYGSKIQYPRVFAGSAREIKLSGEAYFDVKENQEMPFIVKTGSLNVKVLGTEFNVKAYPGDDEISATLVEGKVLLEKASDSEITERLGTMVPGQHVSYLVQTGEIISTNGNIDKYIAWKEGKLMFDNTPIEIVAEELSRKFNVEIEVAADITDLTYTVTFADDPLFLILDLMTETTPVQYHRFPRKKLSDGTFSKQKIRIEKRK